MYRVSLSAAPMAQARLPWPPHHPITVMHRLARRPSDHARASRALASKGLLARGADKHPGEWIVSVHKLSQGGSPPGCGKAHE